VCAHLAAGQPWYLRVEKSVSHIQAG
jgi:hypothetical protein